VVFLLSVLVGYADQRSCSGRCAPVLRETLDDLDAGS
jgi:hypothetical protein